jgi:hypothetical protein
VSVVNAKPSGSFTIKVRAFNSSGGSVLKTFSLTVRNPECSQGALIGNGKVKTGPNQISVAVGDFNSDGIQDLAAAHEGGHNTVSIRFGTGTGTFTDTTELPVGSHPFCVAVGDFDSDGNQDLAVNGSGDNAISILLGNGSGGFVSQLVVDVSWTPVSIVIGDFNEDGKQDLATADYNGASVSVRFGYGQGNFYGTTEVPVGSYPYCISLGDFNSDGHQDFAVANSGNNTISIRFGDGTGNFSGNTEVNVGTTPYSVAVCDFNHDNKQDLVSANYYSNSISIRLGDGSGGFSGNTEIPVGLNPCFVAVGNFNGDNHPDLAVANYFSNNVSIRFGNGSGEFVGNVQENVGPYPISLAVGEFNNDSLSDIAVSSYSDTAVAILLGISGNPPVSPIANNSPVCKGTAIHLGAPGGVLFYWSGPNGFSSSSQNVSIPSSTFNDTGTYHVTITDSSACIITASTHVLVDPLPVVSFALPQDTLCADSPTQLLAGGSPANGHYSGTGVAANQFFPHVSGSGNFLLTYTYTDSVGCTNSATDKMHVVVCTRLEEPAGNINFNVYPNPVNDEFTIDFPPSFVNCKTVLFSPEGKLIKEWSSVGTGKRKFSTNELSTGIYLLLIYSSDNSVLFRSRLNVQR